MSIQDVIDEWKKRDEQKEKNERMKKELYFLLQAIMWNIRMDWYAPWWNPNRVTWRKKWAMEIAEGLNELTVLGRLYALKKGDDGRWLRAPFEEGGYEGMEIKHGYDRNEDDRYNLAEFPDHVLLQVSKLYEWENYFYNFECVKPGMDRLINARYKK